jgi:hypothetical protein
VWLGPLLTGGFVLVAAVIALLSLRWSDLRKLTREDRRQWDAELKASYVAIGEHARAVQVVLRGYQNDAEYSRKMLITIERAMTGIREHIRLFELIAPTEVTKAAESVVETLASLWERLWVDTFDPDFDSRQAIKASFEIEKPINDLRDRIRESLRV